MTLEDLIKEKIHRLESVPLKLQTVLEKKQSELLKNILEKINELTVKDGSYEITTANLNTVANISDELKSALLSEDYLKAVKEFAKEFDKQAVLNNQIFEATFGTIDTPIAAETYVAWAKKSAIQSLVGAPIDKEFIKPITDILESAVVNGASYSDTLDNITGFIKGDKGNNSKLLRYSKQITNDSFAMADRSYASIISDALQNDWYYYSGARVALTRCFCDKRVGNYYHYKEVESWGNGDNLGDCDIGNGMWAGEVDGTNSSTIYTYLGGYNCMHFLISVSEAAVPESDLQNAKDKGYI